MDWEVKPLAMCSLFTMTKQYQEQGQLIIKQTEEMTMTTMHCLHQCTKSEITITLNPQTYVQSQESNPMVNTPGNEGLMLLLVYG